MGVSKIYLSEILKAVIKKTPESYARVYDSYHPLDEVDSEKNIIKRIATLRVILYLEDLGPKSKFSEDEL